MINVWTESLISRNLIRSSLAEITASISALDRRDLDTLRNQLGQCPDKFHVSVIEVFDKLRRIKVHKSVGPDGIPNKLLKYLADILAPASCCHNQLVYQARNCTASVERIKNSTTA